MEHSTVTVENPEKQGNPECSKFQAIWQQCYIAKQKTSYMSRKRLDIEASTTL